MHKTKVALTLEARLVELAGECAKLNPREEKALAGEGLAGSLETWPEY